MAHIANGPGIPVFQLMPMARVRVNQNPVRHRLQAVRASVPSDKIDPAAPPSRHYVQLSLIEYVNCNTPQSIGANRGQAFYRDTAI